MEKDLAISTMREWKAGGFVIRKYEHSKPFFIGQRSW